MLWNTLGFFGLISINKLTKFTVEKKDVKTHLQKYFKGHHNISAWFYKINCNGTSYVSKTHGKFQISYHFKSNRYSTSHDTKFHQHQLFKRFEAVKGFIYIFIFFLSLSGTSLNVYGNTVLVYRRNQIYLLFCQNFVKSLSICLPCFVTLFHNTV